MKNSYVGQKLVAAEKFDTFKSATAAAFDPTDICVAYKNDAGLNIYVTDKDGNYKDEGFAANKTDLYFEVETGYNADFDGDGIIGVGTAYQEQNGSDKILYNQIGKTTIVDYDDQGNLINNYTVKFNGQDMDYKLGSWTMVEAESNSDNTNAVLYKDSVTGDVAYWGCDSEWNFKDGYIASAKSSNLFNLESVYSVDLNDDSIIGLDKNKDNTFNDADFTTLPIEDKGSITMNTDISGQLYAGSYTNKISFFGKHSMSDELTSVGWDIIGVDTGIDPTSQALNNYMVIKESATGQMALCNFGSDWDYGTNDSFELFKASDINDAFKFAEITMVQDFNNNAAIGS